MFHKCWFHENQLSIIGHNCWPICVRNGGNYVWIRMLTYTSALYVKDLNAIKFAQKFPQVTKRAIENTYMDDNSHGTNCDEEAEDLIPRTFGQGVFLSSIGPAVPEVP
ncbi:unnamed protein product [Allacma fusca]|uniref:Uncharacterized protein n=1 Tax=Allacma fusca TaxID=39272 RepID=A0A8J2KS25_9HEXA|nr:unnamed protein product [Allacma fusca]